MPKLAGHAYSGGVATSSATPTATNAAFQVAGTALETYAVTLPSTITLTHTSAGTGTNTLEISQVTARFNGANADATTSTLSTAGTDSFTLGGTLQVKPHQIGGVYSGTFVVTVDYN